MEIMITLDTDNEAFGNGKHEEVVKIILATVAIKIACGEDEGCLLDLVDNTTVCQFTVWGR